MKRKRLGNISCMIAGLAAAAMLLSGCGSSSQTAYSTDRSSAASAEVAAVDLADNGSGSLFRSANGASWDDSEVPDEEVAEDSDAAWSDETAGSEAASSESEVQKEAASEEEAENSQSDRKLITTVDLSVQTREFEKLQKNIEETVAELGGYIENSTVYNNNYWSDYESAEDAVGDRSASYTLRIPEKRLDEFLEKLHDGANVTRESRSVTDITLEYVDVASHKRALETEAKSLEKMMQQATELSDIIQIQSELTDVRYQIDSIESQLRTYDNQVDYSTVNLDVDEVKTYTQPANAGLWTKISTGFMQSLENVGNGILNAAVWIVIHIPQLLVTAAVLAIVGWILKKLRRSGKKRKEKKRAKNHQQEPQSISQPTPQNTDKPAQAEEKK